jgi:hypothetical protein
LLSFILIFNGLSTVWHIEWNCQIDPKASKIRVAGGSYQQMSCAIAEELDRKWKMHRDIANSCSPENKKFSSHLLSPKKAKQKAAEEQQKSLAAFKALSAHTDTCEQCKKDKEMGHSMTAVYCDTEQCKRTGDSKKEIRVFYQPGETQIQSLSCPYCASIIERRIPGKFSHTMPEPWKEQLS